MLLSQAKYTKLDALITNALDAGWSENNASHSFTQLIMKIET